MSESIQVASLAETLALTIEQANQSTPAFARKQIMGVQLPGFGWTNNQGVEVSMGLGVVHDRHAVMSDRLHIAAPDVAGYYCDAVFAVEDTAAQWPEEAVTAAAIDERELYKLQNDKELVRKHALEIIFSADGVSWEEYTSYHVEHTTDEDEDSNVLDSITIPTDCELIDDESDDFTLSLEEREMFQQLCGSLGESTQFAKTERTERRLRQVRAILQCLRLRDPIATTAFFLDGAYILSEDSES